MFVLQIDDKNPEFERDKREQVARILLYAVEHIRDFDKSRDLISGFGKIVGKMYFEE